MSLSTPHLSTHTPFEGISHFFPKHPDQFLQPCEAWSKRMQPLLTLKVVPQLPPLPGERDLAPALKANEVISMWINL